MNSVDHDASFRLIEFEAIYGDEVKIARISRPHGHRATMYSISIDNFHEGRIWLTEHYGWRWDHPLNSDLQKEDFDIVLDIILREGL